MKLMFFDPRLPKNIRSLVKDARPSLVRLAYSWCNNHALAEDLAQEALVLAIKKHHQLREIEKFERWIFTILNNCWREHLRKEKSTQDIDELVIADTTVTEKEILQLQIVERVRHAVSRLPNGQKQVITLVDLQGFSYADVAEILDIPTGTVMSRLNRARQNLKDYLLTFQQELRATKSTLRSVK